MNPPRVGLDARLTRQLSVGMQTYTRELVERLPRVAPEFEYVPFSRGGNFGWDEQVRLPVALRRARLDVVHFLSQYAPVLLPRRFIVTIHDLIHLHFPEHFKAKVGPYYQTLVRRACARAARVITDDERTVEDLVNFLGTARSKIRVVPLGVAESFAANVEPHPAPRPYLLYVGNHRRHKDLPTLFAAWAALPPQLAVDLYLTGPDDFAGDLQARSDATRAIVALGDVPAERLAAYYAGARALVHPSLREGFGLPMLEAMAVRCPVVACEDSLPHVLEGSALTFKARDVDGLERVLERLLGDQGARDRSVKLGEQAAQEFTWDRCARATADVYREVLE